LRVVGKVDLNFVEDIAEMPATIITMLRDGDVLITMGAGSMGAVPVKLQQLLTQEQA
jgi:UDP-N-acetylmuramate--alanine ligase